MYQIAELPLAQYHPQVGVIWRSRDQELGPEVFDELPVWMDREQDDADFQRDIKKLITEAVETLPKREVHILYLRFWLDLTYEEIGAAIGVTKARARQIELKALRKLKHPSRRDPLISYSLWSADPNFYGRTEFSWWRKFT